MHSSLPVSKSRPAMILKCGRSTRDAGCTPRTMMFVVVPFWRCAIGMFSSSSAAIGLPSLSFSIPGKTSSSSAFDVSKPPVVSVTEPLRITIKSSGSPETFRLCSSPSTRPNRMHDDQTTSPVPSVVITVVFQRTRRLRTLYLSGIMAAQITLRRPSITERFAARTAG